MSLSLAREVAYDAFAAVVRGGKKPEEFLDAAYEHHKKLKRLDRAFIKELVFGSLRWYGKLFWILQHTSHRDLEKSSGEIISALILGTYQIYYMDKVPDRAAVNESVEYIRRRGQESACSFVNGILRQIANRAQYFPKPDKEKEPEAYLSMQYSHPMWIVKRWSQHFKFDRLAVILAANNQPPPITIRCNLLKVPAEESFKLQEQLLRDENIHSDRAPLREALKLKAHPPIGPGSAFATGLFTFQDEASQLVGHLLDPQPGDVVIDMCAGPGGKLSHIYELAGGDLTLFAIERDSRQLFRAQQTMARLGHEKGVEWIHGDSLEVPLEVKADRVLLDAPCSGLGVLRRHPEGKLHKTEAGVLGLVEVQRRLLERGLSFLKVGGTLVYSVCSFELEETAAHLNYLDTTYGDKIEIISPYGRMPDMYRKYVSKQQPPMLHIFSGNSHEMDGFSAFIVKVLAPL